MKDKPPLLELEDVVDIKTMSREDLDKVQFDILYWICGVDNCWSSTRIRDYGIHPEYYWPAKKEWINIHQVYMYCGNCRKKYKQYFDRKKPVPDPKPMPESCRCMYPVSKENMNELKKSDAKTNVMY